MTCRSRFVAGLPIAYATMTTTTRKLHHYHRDAHVMLTVLTSEMADDMVPVNEQPSCEVEHKRRDAVREGAGVQNVIDEEIAGDWYTGS